MGEELRALARFVGELRLETVPDDVVRAARFCVLDTLGSALGATRSREIRAITAELEDWSGVGKNHRLASAWGQGTRTSLNNAVLVNGMLSHELELDDVHTASKSHVGAVVDRGGCHGPGR
jgi:2-methylcitrate dehydratase PrpD